MIVDQLGHCCGHAARDALVVGDGIVGTPLVVRRTLVPLRLHQRTYRRLLLGSSWRRGPVAYRVQINHLVDILTEPGPHIVGHGLLVIVGVVGVGQHLGKAVVTADQHVAAPRCWTDGVEIGMPGTVGSREDHRGLHLALPGRTARGAGHGRLLIAGRQKARRHLLRLFGAKSRRPKGNVSA